MGEVIQKVESMIQCPKCGALHPDTVKECNYCGLNLKEEPPTPPLEHKPDRDFEMELRDGTTVEALRIKTTDDRIVEMIRSHGYEAMARGFVPVGDSPKMSPAKHHDSWIWIAERISTIEEVIRKKPNVTRTKKRLGPFRWTSRKTTYETVTDTVENITYNIIAKMVFYKKGEYHYGSGRYNHESFYYLEAVDPEAIMPLAQAISAIPDVERLRISLWECECHPRIERYGPRYAEGQRGHFRWCLWYYKDFEELKKARTEI